MTVSLHQIVMHTPLGQKQGQLQLEVQENKVFGYLNILGHTQPIHGRIEADGSCRLEGHIVTLMRTVPFIADGWVTDDAVSLTLRGDRNVFWIKGTAAAGEGGHLR